MSPRLREKPRLSVDGGLRMHANRGQVCSSRASRLHIPEYEPIEKGIVALFAPRGDRYTRGIVSVGVEIER